MRSSSYEAALIRFEARMGSAIISDIVRGLVGILRGDDGRMYFQMLSHDLKALELQRLKAKAAKIPPKIRGPRWAIDHTVAARNVFQIKIKEAAPRAFFAEKGMDVDIIKIEGSVELAPILSLTDAIVDIVETAGVSSSSM